MKTKQGRESFSGQGFGSGPLARSDFDEDGNADGGSQPAKGLLLAENGDILQTESGDNLQLE